MEFALPTAVAALALILLYLRIRLRQQGAGVAGPDASRAERATVVLDVGEVHAEGEVVQRMVREAAARVMAESREVTDVEVRSRDGTLLGRVTSGAKPVPSLDSPLQFLEPHVIRRTPEPPPRGLEDELHPTVTPHFDAKERPAPRRPLADTFDLPGTVRARLADPDDPVELVRAILEASGLQASVVGDMIRTGDEAIIVLSAGAARTFMHDALNHAYLRFRESGGTRGLVVSLGYMDPTDVRKRELLAPELRHVGSEGIQRMADAVAIGADPLAFATAPRVIATTVRQTGGQRGNAHRAHRKAG